MPRDRHHIYFFPTFWLYILFGGISQGKVRDRYLCDTSVYYIIAIGEVGLEIGVLQIKK